MDSDDELQRALQLSLVPDDNSALSKSPAEVIDLIGDETIWPGFEDLDEMELWKGIAMSMGLGICAFPSGSDWV